MQHLKCFVTIAVLGMLTLCFRHWPDMSRESDRGLLQALTQLPLLSIKRVVGAWCGAPFPMRRTFCDLQLLVAASLNTCSSGTDVTWSVTQAGWCWLRLS